MLKVIYIVVRTLIFVLSGMGNHWKVSSKEVMCSGLHFKRIALGASLVAQWLRICLLMRGTRVRALVWEDPTCHRAAGPVSHNY